MELSQREQLIMEIGMLRGNMEMAWDLAVWRNGTPTVGVNERPYKEFIQRYLDQEAKKIAKLKGKTLEPKKDRFSYSLDEYSYHGQYDSRDDAIRDAVQGQDFDGEAFHVWTGRNIPLDDPEFDDRHLDMVLESMAEYMEDNHALDSEPDFNTLPQKTKDQFCVRLTHFFHDWFDENEVLPSKRMWEVEDVQHHRIEPEIEAEEL